jgi:hypothetical protein
MKTPLPPALFSVTAERCELSLCHVRLGRGVDEPDSKKRRFNEGLSAFAMTREATLSMTSAAPADPRLRSARRYYCARPDAREGSS